MSDEKTDDTNITKKRYNTARGRYMFKIGALVLVAGIVLLGISYFAFTETQASVEAEAEESLVNAAEREANGLDGFIGDMDENALAMSSESIYAEGDDADIQDRFEEDIEILPNVVQNIHLYNMETGEIEVSTDLQQEGLAVGENDRSWAVSEDEFDSTDDVASFDP